MMDKASAVEVVQAARDVYAQYLDVEAGEPTRMADRVRQGFADDHHGVRIAAAALASVHATPPTAEPDAEARARAVLADSMQRRGFASEALGISNGSVDPLVLAMLAAMSTFAAQEAARGREGMVLVPREPTEAMRAAWAAYWASDGPDTADGFWNAMIAARPTGDA